MQYWNPQSLMKPDENGLFQMNETVTVVKSVRTPMQRQRDADGTPHTITGRTALRPEGPKLTLDSLSKGCTAEASKEPDLDVDAVVKAYMGS